MRKITRRGLGACAFGLAAGVALHALAQGARSPLDRQIELWCANDGQWIKVVADNPWVQYAWYALVGSAGASLVANARGCIEKRAPWLMPVIDFAALNWREILARLPAPPAVPPQQPRPGAPKP